MHAHYGRSFLFVVAGLLSVALFVQVCAADETQVTDRAALVNGAVITRKDFESELQRQTRMRKGNKAPGPAQFAALKKQVLESLIIRELLYQEARRRGVTLPVTLPLPAVKGQVAELKRKIGGEAAFKSALAAQGLSEAAFEAQIERGMIVQKFIDSEFAAKIPVTDDEVGHYYEDHPDDFKEPLRVRISRILIKADPAWDEKQRTAARARLELVRQRLLAGGDFARVARETAECPDCKEGGDLGYVRRGELAKNLDDAVFALQPGEVSGIVEDGEGFHLLKVTDLRPATVLPLASVQEKIRQDLAREKQQKAMAPYLKKLRSEAKVEILLDGDGE